VKDVDPSRPRRWLGEYGPLALRLAGCALTYLPSLHGPLLGYDDDWLISRNTILRDPSLDALRSIWLDLSFKTRLVLGAEYLPVRDTSLWLEARLWGLEAGPLRLTQLVLYLAAVTAIRAALRRSWPDRIGVELATAVFALHPVHVESVAWLASRKDILALLFIALSLVAYASDRPSRRWLAPAAILAACLSKSMSVAAPALLVAQDLLAHRRPHWGALGAAVGAAALSLVPHLAVGATVNMVATPLGGSRLTAALSMGPVWLRYLGILVWPPSLSIVHEVAPLTQPTAAAVAGYGLLTIWALLGTWLWWRRGYPLPLVAWLWFAAPLGPVSQIAFPLQNVMADRYAFLSVMALALGVGAAASAVIRRWKRSGPRAVGLVSGVGLAVLGVATARRAALFADEGALFVDAMPKAPHSCLPHYQAGKYWLDRGDLSAAVDALDVVLTRCPPPSGIAQRATNNLARAYVKLERWADAERVLRAGRLAWPDDPTMLGNLVRVMARSGRTAEARELFEELQRRFPRYLSEPAAERVGP
jgi:hypothetical protein